MIVKILPSENLQTGRTFNYLNRGRVRVRLINRHSFNRGLWLTSKSKGDSQIKWLFFVFTADVVMDVTVVIDGQFLKTADFGVSKHIYVRLETPAISTRVIK